METRHTLVYKKGNPTQPKNWRPITLLNTDYKILTNILINRLKSVTPSLIEHSQKCGIPGRQITDILGNVKAAIDQAYDKKNNIIPRFTMYTKNEHCLKLHHPKVYLHSRKP